MKPAEPCVTILVPCYADGEIAGSPDMFRLPLTPSLMGEIIGLQEFFRETNASLGERFPGKKLSYMDLPFHGFVAEGEDEDADVDTRLEGEALRVREDGVYFMAKMRVARAGLKSERFSSEELESRFAELRELMLSSVAQEAVDHAIGDVAESCVSARRASGLSL